MRSRDRGDLAGAAAALAEARALWRGPALADVRATPFAEPEAVRLDELRLLVEEDWFDAELALGHHAVLVDPLTSAVHEHPMRERFWGQLMTALYRSDRQADALATYARARERLADELGIDPGQALQQLELAILRQDPSIAPPPPTSAAAPVAVVAPRSPSRVPRPMTPTFGRDALVADVQALLRREDVRALTLTGPGGSGKSRVAALAALAADDDFDGVVHLALTEQTGVAQVLAEVALALTGSDDVDGLDGLATDTLRGPRQPRVGRGRSRAGHLDHRAHDRPDRAVDQPAAAADQGRARRARAPAGRPRRRTRPGPRSRGPVSRDVPRPSRRDRPATRRSPVSSTRSPSCAASSTASRWRSSSRPRRSGC